MTDWEAWRERIVENGQFVPPEVWVASLYPTPYFYVNHGWAGYTVTFMPSMHSILDYRYKSIMVWVN